MSSLLSSGECLGQFVWAERRGFELLGGWSVTLADPVAKAAMDRHAAHHAWRAAQLWDRLPVLAQVDRDDLVNVPAGTVGPMVEVLAGLSNPVGQLAGAYRVALPRLAAAYRAWLAAANPLSDGPAIRTVTMCLADVDADRIEGDELLQAALTTSAEAYAAGNTVARLEAVLAGASPGMTQP